MSPQTIPENHLRSCEEHNIVGGGVGGSGKCPVCEVDVDIEARPSDVITGKPIELQQKMEDETMIELIPLMKEYLDDRGKDEPWVAIIEVPEDKLPMGYTKQERWINCLRYNWGALTKTLVRKGEAQETIETLKEEGYGD